MDQYIVADIGGTNARFAIVADDHTLREIQILPCAEYASPLHAIKEYLARTGIAKPAGICMAIAGITSNDTIDMLNSHWCFSQKALADSLNTRLIIINDFTAQAMCIELLAESELHWLDQQRPDPEGIRLVMGPGTGLGVAAQLPSGDIVPSEGGHIGFAPVTEHQIELLRALQGRYGNRISVERLISGQGLENLFWANSVIRGQGHQLSALQISDLADSGDELALHTIADLFDILALTAGDFAITFWSDGGVYLTGGVLKKLTKYLDPVRFRSVFSAKGRLESFCSDIAIGIVQADQPGLLGCCAALRLKV